MAVHAVQLHSNKLLSAGKAHPGILETKDTARYTSSSSAVRLQGIAYFRQHRALAPQYFFHPFLMFPRITYFAPLWRPKVCVLGSASS